MDAFEINFSCPHGMPERKMGMAMGQDLRPARGAVVTPVLPEHFGRRASLGHLILLPMQKPDLSTLSIARSAPSVH